MKKLMLSLFLCGSSMAAPDLNSVVWHPVRPDTALKPADAAVVPLLPEAHEIYLRHQAQYKAKDLSFDPMQRCQPPGISRLLSQAQPFEFLQRDERIFITYQWNRLVRVVDMNVPQPEPIGPAFLGQSVGTWQGDTLVIDSISFDEGTLLDDLGMPHSDQLHVTERYQLAANGKQLQLRLTIEDPLAFSKPWDVVMEFRAEPRGRLAEDVCVERQNIIFWKEQAP